MTPEANHTSHVPPPNRASPGPLESRWSQRVTWIAFGLMILAGGFNGIGIRFTNRELEPFWGATLRFGWATLLFIPAALAARQPFPRGRALLGALLYGVLGFGFAYATAYWALVELQAGLAQILLALVPLAALFLAMAHGLERFRFRIFFGGLISVLGISLIFYQGLDSAPWPRVAALLLGTLCMAETAVVVKRFPPLNPFLMNAIGMGTGTLLLLAFSFATGESHPVPVLATTWAWSAYLATVGSAVLFLLYLFVLSRLDVSVAAYQFVLYPVVTVAASAWLDSERLAPGVIAGSLVVLAGVYVGALRARSGNASRPESDDRGRPGPPQAPIEKLG